MLTPSDYTRLFFARVPEQTCTGFAKLTIILLITLKMEISQIFDKFIKQQSVCQKQQ